MTDIDWGDAAGWTQAVGSLLAIYASYMFAKAEGDRAKAELAEERRREAEARARADAEAIRGLARDRETAAAILDLASEILTHGIYALRHPEAVAFVTVSARALADQLAACERRLETFPVEILRSPLLTGHLARGQLNVGVSRAFCQDLSTQDPATFPPTIGEQCASLLESHRRKIDSVRDAFLQEGQPS